ncbi:MAG: hypothetical protein LBU14_05505 [Candidatus Peribacteria bacterium]|jgi:hypothetical protein|nr:hypothetical protein [Candidatus Peribacteria bacterium]
MLAENPTSLNEETKKDLSKLVFTYLLRLNEKVPMFRYKYPDINEYLEYMAKVGYCMKEMLNDDMDENIKLSKEDVVFIMKKYFILDAPAIQYLQSH